MINYPRYKRRCTIVPNLSDLSEDLIRSRLIYPIVGIIVYILIAFVVTDITEVAEIETATIQSKLPHAVEYSIGPTSFFEDYSTSPRLSLKTEQKALSNVTLYLKFSDYVANKNLRNPDCDYDTRSNIAGSLEYLRLINVCKVEIDNAQATTNSLGLATFKNITIKRAPEGLYGLKYSTSTDSFSSDEIYTFLRSPAANIQILNQPPESISCGTPFEVQPKVRVTDINGSPLVGKTVVAFSWTEPAFYGGAAYYGIMAPKYAQLIGDLSEITDSSGIATFTNLTIIGTTSSNVYIYLTCDSVITTLWGRQKPVIFNFLSLTYFARPITVLTDVYQLQFISQMPTEVTEGEALSPAPIIRVVSKDGQALQGKVVFAVISRVNDDILPMGYMRKQKGIKNKYLKRPIPGVYATDYENPLYSDLSWVPILTNSAGIVTFSQLRFSVEGPSGNYRIRFYCDGVYIESEDISVKTTVKKIKFHVQPPAYFDLNENEIIELAPTIQILNENGVGVPGKTPVVQAILTTGGEFRKDEFVMDLDIQNDLFAPSGSDGFVKLFFKLTLNKYSVTHLKLAVIVDNDVRTFSRDFKIQNDIALPACGNLVAISFPDTIFLDTPFSSQFRIYDSSGKSFQGRKVTLELVYFADYPTLFPFDIIPSLESYTGTSDSNGIVNFKNIKLSYGPQGHIYLRARSYSLLSEAKLEEILEPESLSTLDPLEDDLDSKRRYYQSQNVIQFCYSDILRVLIAPKVSKVRIENFGTTLPWDFHVLNMDQTYTVLLRVYDENGNIPETSIIDLTVILNIIELPHYLYYQYEQEKTYTSFINFTQINTYAEISGLIPVNLTILNGNPGYYAINFQVQGAYTEPFLFKTDFPPSKLTIVQEPYYKRVYSSGYQPVGEYVEPPQIKLTNSAGNPLVNYTVVAQLSTSNTSYEYAYLDIGDFGGRSQLAITVHRVAKTDSNGIAKFSNLSIMDIRNKGCVKFQFYVGSQDKVIQSIDTQPICFTQSYTIYLSNDIYSRTITANQLFTDQLSVSVIKTSLSDMDNYGFTAWMIIPVELNGEGIPSPAKNVFFNTENQLCIYYQGKLLSNLGQACSTTFQMIGGETSQKGSVTFKEFQWTIPLEGNKLKFSIASPLNYKSSYSGIDDTDVRFYTLTEAITLTNKPFITQISQQPPQKVYVGDIFQVTLASYIKTLAPVARATINAGINPDQSLILKIAENKMTLQKFMSKLDSGAVQVQTLTDMNADLNIVLDSDRAIAKTYSDGTATFNLKISAGFPGYYQLLFQAKGFDRKILSTKFYLENRIVSATILNDIQQVIVKTLEVSGTKDFIKLDVQPRIQLKYLNDEQTVTDKRIEFRIFKYVDIGDYTGTKIYLKQGINANAYLRNKAESDIEFLSSSPANSLLNLWELITNAGKLQNTGEDPDQGLQYKYTYPTEDAEGILEFKDLRIKFVENGEYMLGIVVDGIETQLSGKISINAEEVSLVDEYTTSAVDKIIIIGSCIVVLISNTAWHKSLWLALYACGIGLALWFTTYTDIYTDEQRIGYYITYSLLGLLLLQIVIELLMRAQKRIKLVNETREEIYYEYTFQKLFNRPSYRWLQQKLKKEKYEQSPFQDVLEREGCSQSADDVYNGQPKTMNIVQSDEVNTLKGGDRQNGNYQEKSILRVSQQKVEAFWESEKEKHQKPVQYCDLGFVARAKRTMKPFALQSNQVWIEDCFFFPQRILVGLFLSVLSVVIIGITILSYIDSASDQVQAIADTIEDTLNSIISQGVNSYKNNLENEKFKETQISFFADVMEFLIEQLNALSDAVQIGFRIGLGLSGLIFFLLNLNLLTDFQYQAMSLRRGDWTFEAEDGNQMSAAQFIGIFISNEMLGYAFSVIITGIVFTVLCMPILWNFLWDSRTLILAAIYTSIGSIIFSFLLDKYSWHPKNDGIRIRMLHAIQEFIALYTKMASALFASIGRFVKVFIAAIISIANLHKNMIPDHMQSLIGDEANEQYLSVIKSYHVYNNPIVFTFTRLLLSKLDYTHFLLADNKRALFKKRRIANYFWLAVLLYNNPSLIDERKSQGANLAADVKLLDSGPIQIINSSEEKHLNEIDKKKKN